MGGLEVPTTALTRCKLFFKHKLGQLRKSLYGTHAKAILVKSKNGMFLVDIRDQVIGRDLLKRGEYSIAEIKRIQKYLDTNSILLIVGAHIGTLTIPLSRSCRRIVAVEANPATFELLKLNLLINGAANVQAIAAAANDRSEDLEFLSSITNTGGTKRRPLIRRYEYTYDSPKSFKAKGRPLDEELCGAHFDVVVMDIEGSEYYALRGMQRILSGASTLFVEYLPHHLRYVAGVTVGQFLEPISQHFSWLTIPGAQVTVTREQFLMVLQSMYNDDVSAEIIFSKRPPAETS
jgi:FkbM family methyltransferase